MRPPPRVEILIRAAARLYRARSHHAGGSLEQPVAVHASVQIVRAFVHLREMLSGHRDLAEKLAGLEQRYDHQFKVVFDAIRELMIQERTPKKEIGFKASGRW